RAGLANQPSSVHRDDGLKLRDCYISATARCAPPDNKPLPDEVENCAPYLDAEWDALKNKRVIMALGKIAWDAAIRLVRRHDLDVAKGIAFGHGAEIPLTPRLSLVGSYHVSQQNTFTGKLTAAMLDAVVKRCLALASRTITR